jgi:hypothetical protein
MELDRFYVAFWCSGRLREGMIELIEFGTVIFHWGKAKFIWLNQYFLFLLDTSSFLLQEAWNSKYQTIHLNQAYPFSYQRLLLTLLMTSPQPLQFILLRIPRQKTSVESSLALIILIGAHRLASKERKAWGKIVSSNFLFFDSCWCPRRGKPGGFFCRFVLWILAGEY